MEEKRTMPLPEEFCAAMRAQLGEAGFAAYLHAMEKPHERGLRVNLLRDATGAPPKGVEGIGATIPWAQGAYFVEGDARPGLHPLHEGGMYYLQEPSAMSAATVLAPRPGERVLDLCAAPGGKSTQIAAMMQGEGVLVANEPIPARAQILSRNVERMGVANALVTNMYPDALCAHFPVYFDAILVDAPCSGEGMFRRQIEARGEWDAQSPQLCAARQSEILRSAARMLRPGGRMVYSTCTFNAVENEGVVQKFLDEEKDFVLVPFALEGLGEKAAGMAHLYPQDMRGEGHFVALLRRQGESCHAKAPDAAQRDKAAEALWQPLVDEVLKKGVTFANVRRIGDGLYSLPEGIREQRGLRVLRYGVCLARLKGRHWAVDHALAMALRPEQARNTIALSVQEALRYQHGEVLDAPEGTKKGFALVTLEDCPLGWVKCVEGQMKNHYPKGLRR